VATPRRKKVRESELCFVISGHHDKFIEERARERLAPAKFSSPTGKSLGPNEFHRFRSGQRKSLGWHGAAFVRDSVDPATGDVMLGARPTCARLGRAIRRPSCPDLVTPCSVDCMVRYRGQMQPAHLN